jgi:hypothetical protein
LRIATAMRDAQPPQKLREVHLTLDYMQAELLCEAEER